MVCRRHGLHTQAPAEAENQVRQQLELAGLRRKVQIVGSSCSVGAAAKGFDGLIERSCRGSSAALKHHVFEDIGDAFFAKMHSAAAGKTIKIKANEWRIVPRWRHATGATGQTPVI